MHVFRKNEFVMNLFDTKLAYYGANKFNFELPKDFYQRIESRPGDLTRMRAPERILLRGRTFFLVVKEGDFSPVRHRQNEYQAAKSKVVAKSRVFLIRSDLQPHAKKNGRASSEELGHEHSITQSAKADLLREHYDHVTILTVGTWGDVQPYISFCQVRFFYPNVDLAFNKMLFSSGLPLANVK